MKKLVSSQKNSKVGILVVAIILVIVVVIAIVCANVIRKNRINNQALENINEENMTTTIFCSGKNVKLKQDVYNKLKNEGYALTIYNNKYIVTISNENLNQKIDLDIDVEKYKESDDEAFKVDLNNVNYSYVSIKSKIENRGYLSEYYLGDNTTFIKNNAKVEDGYVELELQDSTYVYILSYVIPDDIEVQDIQINKGASKKVELGINEEEYTLGSVSVECSDSEAIEVDSEYNIVGKKVGEYTLKFYTEKYSKEAKLTVLQSVESISLDKTTLNMLEDGTAQVVATVTPDDAVNKELKWTSSDESIVVVDENGNITAKKAGNCEITVSTVEEPIVETKLIIEVTESPSLSSLFVAPTTAQVDGITYIDGIMLVNKTHSVPSDYAPGLNSQAYEAFLQLQADAADAGYDIPLLSGYRSYETQTRLYNNYVATYGQEEADTFSARPGTSEHQTGLAMDVGQIEDWYGDTEAGQWLAQNCYKYGFIIRYPKGKESITGYKYEPWHIRYLGVDIATKVYNSGLTLEEYLGVE